MLVVVDAQWLMRKIYHRCEKSGTYKDAPKQFIEHISALIGKLSPSHMAVCWDGNESFRKEIDPEYKSNRKSRPVGFDWAVTEATNYLEMHQIRCVTMEPYEADDLIASYVAQYPDKAIIYGVDKDFNQLLENGRVTKLREFDPDHRLDRSCWFPRKDWLAKIGCTEDDMPDAVELQCLIGDGTDVVRGADLIGEKKALIFLKEYGSLDALLGDIDNAKIGDKPLTDKQKESLREFKPRYETVKKLIELKKDIPVDMRIECPSELPIRW